MSNIYVYYSLFDTYCIFKQVAPWKTFKNLIIYIQLPTVFKFGKKTQIACWISRFLCYKRTAAHSNR